MTDPALAAAVQMIAGFEGFSAEPYQDIAEIWTIGYGTIYLPDGSRVMANSPPTTREAEEPRLQAAVGKVIASVRDMTHVPLSTNQTIALASLAYNIGTGALRSSTLMRLLNERNFAAAAGQFAVWDRAGGQRSPALDRRRKAEAALFVRPDEAAPPVSIGATVVPAPLFTADLSAQNVKPSDSDALNDAEIATFGTVTV